MDANCSRDDDIRKAVSLLDQGVQQRDLKEAIAIIDHDIEERVKTDPGYSARFQRRLNDELVATGKLPNVLLEFANENIRYFKTQDVWDREKPVIRKSDLYALVAKPEWDRGPRPTERVLYAGLLNNFERIDRRSWVEDVLGSRDHKISLDEIERWKNEEIAQNPPADCSK